MKKREAYARQLEEGIAEMEATIERLREEIQRLIRERELEQARSFSSTKDTEPSF